MSETDEYKLSFQFLEKPVRISEQRWDADVQPFVSISCITFNHEKYIRDAFEGFLMQETTFPVEILVHDDASTDSTADIIREYEARYPSLFRVIYQNENQYSKKVKIGFTYQYPRVRGKYYATCEGDDYWIDSLKLQKQVCFLETHSSFSLCFHNALVIRDDEQKEFAILETREYSGSEILEKWLIPTASVVLKSESIKNLKSISKNFLFGDIVLFLTVAETGRIWCINEFMSAYRKHLGGISYQGNSDIEKLKKFIIHHEEIARSFSGKYRNVEDIVLGKYYLFLSLKYVKCGSFKFLHPLFKSIYHSPFGFPYNFISTLRSKALSLRR